MVGGGRGEAQLVRVSGCTSCEGWAQMGFIFSSAFSSAFVRLLHLLHYPHFHYGNVCYDDFVIRDGVVGVFLS